MWSKIISVKMWKRIVGKESYEDIKPDVKIENRMNFATISVLFVICRLLFYHYFIIGVL